MFVTVVDLLMMCSLSVQLIQYISDLGGVLGLWFGFAFMTFIEIFELCSDMFVLLLYKIYETADKR